jgi:hypothetical protein
MVMVGLDYSRIFRAETRNTGLLKYGNLISAKHFVAKHCSAKHFSVEYFLVKNSRTECR